jgi:hypothetical protein
MSDDIDIDFVALISEAFPEEAETLVAEQEPAREEPPRLNTAEGIRAYREEHGLNVNRVRERIVDTDGLLALPPVEPLIEGWLGLNTLAMLYGASGSGKSFAALDMAAHVATGLCWHGHEVRQGKVLYVIGEGAWGLGRRALAWENRYGIRPPIQWHVGAGDLTDPNWVEELGDVLAEDLPDLVVIDTYARSTAGMDENSSKDTGLVVKHMDQLRRACDACIFPLHHSGKDESRGARGSTALKAAMDYEINVERSGDVISLTTTKVKDGREPYPIVFRLVDENDSAVLEVSSESPVGKDVAEIVAMLDDLNFPIGEGKGFGRGNAQKLITEHLAGVETPPEWFTKKSVHKLIDDALKLRRGTS